MIPVGDDTGRKSRAFPIINVSIIVLNFLVFFYQLTLGSNLDAFILGYGNVPYEMLHGVDLRSGLYGDVPQFPGPTPIYLTLLTSIFMHGGWAHILGNMLYLFIFGDNVEDALGSLTYLFFYLLAGLAATASHIAVTVMTGDNVYIPSVGASGAIAGVLGAYLVLFPKAQVNTLIFFGFFGFMTRIAAIFVLGFWFVSQLFSGVAGITTLTSQTSGGGVAFFAHIGGFVFGALIALLFFRDRGVQTKAYAGYEPRR